MFTFERKRKDTMILNMGPSHNATHGTLRIVLELDGEIITNATIEIGYLHRGIEKMAEHRTYNGFIPLTDRMNYVSPIMNNISYALAVEKLLGIEVPQRGRYIRVIMNEFTRIADHLVAIGTNVVDIGALTNYFYFFKERERIYDLIEKVVGARLTTTFTRVGGIQKDVADDFGSDVRFLLKEIPKSINDVDKLLTKNRIFMDRTIGVGAITRERALEYGFTGPVLRATGLEWDLRKKQPYSSYEDFQFDIPIGENGDTYDRYLVRMEEMRQSLRIIQEAIDNLPGGPVRVDDPHITLPPKEDVYNTMEGLIHHFMLIMYGIKAKPGYVYFGTEVANGELGFYIVSDGEQYPYRLKVRPPCFAIFQAFPELIKGHLISDAIAILGSLNIVAGELDR